MSVLTATSCQTAEHLGAIFAPDDAVTLRPIETWVENGQKRSRVDHKAAQCTTVANIGGAFLDGYKAASARQHTNLFYGVCPRFDATPGFDLAWQIRTVRCLWSDIDDCADAGELAERLSRAGLPEPSITITSGHGFHLYWILSEPYLIDDVDDPPQVNEEWTELSTGRNAGKRRPLKFYVDQYGDRVWLHDQKNGRPTPHDHPDLSPRAVHVQDLLAGIAQSIGGDHTTDLSRLLRLPGTMNRKDERNGRDPVPCEILRMTEARYRFDEFERFAELSQQKQERQQIAAIQLPKPRKLTPGKHDKLTDYINRCAVAQNGQRSDADFSLCCFAIEKGIDRVDVWSHVSGVGKFAERGEEYFDRTWTAAETRTRRNLYDKVQRRESKPIPRPAADAVDADGMIEVDRIEVEVSANEHLTIRDALHGLKRSEDIFCRGGRLVHVVNDDASSEGVARAGTPHIRDLPAENLREVLAETCFFYRDNDETGRQHVAPPAWCVGAIHSRGAWPGVRRLTGVTTSPTLRPDGTILDAPGYDAATGLLFMPDGPLPEVPDNPTLADAIDAANALVEVVADFPFAKLEHQAAWLAGVLTPIARTAFSGPAPMFLIDANVRGSGKSLLCDATGEIATGAPMPRLTAPRDDDEARKRITAIAEAGDRVILLDNIAGTLGSASLDAAITAETWRDRRLGKTEMVQMPMNAIWYATGNNVVLKADTSRRVCHIRLDSPEESPEERTGFRHPNLRAYVQGNRTRLLGAALTLLRAFVVAGRPQERLTPWGSFEGWSDFVRQAVVWIGLPDPAGTRRELAENSDRDAVALRQIIGGWDELDPDCHGLTTRQIAERLEHQTGQHDALRSGFDELCPKGITSRSIGYALRKFKGRTVGSRRLDSRTGHGGTQVWFVRGGGDDGNGGDAQPPYARVKSFPLTGEEKDTEPEPAVASPPSPASPPGEGAAGECRA